MDRLGDYWRVLESTAGECWRALLESTPVELERLNGFPDNHTEGVTNGYRAFFMGNALVCGIVKRIGDNIE